MSSSGSRRDTARVLVLSNTASTSASNSSSLITAYGSSRYILLIASPNSSGSGCWPAVRGWGTVLAGDRPRPRSTIDRLWYGRGPSSCPEPSHIARLDQDRPTPPRHQRSRPPARDD